jgi:hypothetical protein
MRPRVSVPANLIPLIKRIAVKSGPSGTAKPIRFVFPQGITAAEAAKLLQEFAEKQAGKADEGDEPVIVDNGGETRK